LEVKCPARADETKGIGVAFEGARGNRMYLAEIEEAEELILGFILVIGKMCRPQDKPSLFPCL
jgi:hypothetical protein